MCSYSGIRTFEPQVGNLIGAHFSADVCHWTGIVLTVSQNCPRTKLYSISHDRYHLFPLPSFYLPPLPPLPLLPMLSFPSSLSFSPSSLLPFLPSLSPLSPLPALPSPSLPFPPPHPLDPLSLFSFMHSLPLPSSSQHTASTKPPVLSGRNLGGAGTGCHDNISGWPVRLVVYCG